jgi:hypothetical protein
LRKPVCFQRNPASGSKCTDSSCQKAHLDTSDSAQLERYTRAFSAFEANQTYTRSRSALDQAATSKSQQSTGAQVKNSKKDE